MVRACVAASCYNEEFPGKIVRQTVVASDSSNVSWSPEMADLIKALEMVPPLLIDSFSAAEIFLFFFFCFWFNISPEN